MAVLRSAVVLLLCSFVAGSGDAADVPTLAKEGAESAEIRRQMETASASYSHFATTDIVTNRPTMRQWPEELIAEQAELLTKLRTWSRQPEALRALIGHRDPKVRTLALGALFVREDPHELPLIASLTADEAPTFPHVHFSFKSDLTIDLKDVISSQTVGDVAQAMLVPYLRFAPRDTKSRFAEYWREREGRSTCASWFLVKMERATRCTSPLQAAYQQDVQRVLAEVQELPASDLAWTQVFLRCMSVKQLDEVLTDATCLSALREIGPDPIVRFLKRERVTDDPDLRFDNLERSRIHSFMSHFILRRARGLLRVEDVPALLECEEFERKTPGHEVSPYWAAAAAEVTAEDDPTAASQIIDAALERFPLSAVLGGRHQAALIGSLWRIQGSEEKQRIVDWFYEAQAKVIQKKSDRSNHGPADFLGSVRAAGRADTKELMAALVADSRFDQADWPALKGLLEIANEGLPEPLVSQQEIHSVWPPQQHEARAATAFAKWREILKHHYAFSGQ
jgi:hypothetical protein